MADGCLPAQPNGIVVAVILHPSFTHPSVSRVVERSQGLSSTEAHASLKIQDYLGEGTSECRAIPDQV